MQMGEKTGNKFVSETAAAAGIHKKRHLVITGSRGIGKSTLLREILALPYFSDLGPFPGFTTQAFPRDRVELTDNLLVKLRESDPAIHISPSLFQISLQIILYKKLVLLILRILMLNDPATK